MANRKLAIGLSFTSLALCTAYAGGCVSSTSSGPDAGGAGEEDGGGSTSSSSSGGGASSSSSGGTTGDATGSSSGASSGGGTALTPDPTGYVSVTGLGIQGAWYGYGDGWGTTGMPPGVCETTGMHTTPGACSTITFPPAGMANAEGGVTATFPQTTPGTMCLSGTAAKVPACVAGVSGCTMFDYSNVFGIGIGLDFDNVMGVKMPYNAPMNKVTGFTFTISGVPATGIRVEFPTTDTNAMGSDSYAIAISKDGNYTADLKSGTAIPDLSPSFTATPTQPAFNAANLLSIQFHVPTVTTSSITVTNMCVSNLTAIVSP